MLVDNHENDFEMLAWEYEDRLALWEGQILEEYERTESCFLNAVDNEMRGE